MACDQAAQRVARERTSVRRRFSAARLLPGWHVVIGSDGSYAALGEAAGPGRIQPAKVQRQRNLLTYFVEIAVAEPCDPRLVREAKNHLRVVVNARHLAAAEKLAATSPARARALANATAAAAFARALPDLDRLLALGGRPEDLEFELPEQGDTRCEAWQKGASYEYSERRFFRWSREKRALLAKLRATYIDAATTSGPETAVAATALYSFVVASTDRALHEPDDRHYRCPATGFVHPPDDVWSDDVDHAVSLCNLLANRYTIDTEHSRFCRIDKSTLDKWSHPMMEISPSALFMAHVCDNEGSPSFGVPASPAPLRAKPRPPQVPCPKRGAPETRARAHVAHIFSDDHPRFPENLPDELAARFPPPQ